MKSALALKINKNNPELEMKIERRASHSQQLQGVLVVLELQNYYLNCKRIIKEILKFS